MTEFVKDTSKDYDHMIGYVAEENLNRATLDVFLGETEKKDYKPEVKRREKDPEFPEDWQHLYVNFDSFENYATFMNELGTKPVPKLKEYIFEPPDQKSGLSQFFGD
jgi:hypothetical protein